MSTFSGSLHAKRKADLVEIAQALHLPDDAKIADLVKSIQAHLDQNEAELAQSPQFKGLYHRRTRHSVESSDSDVVADLKEGVQASAKKARKSVNKIVDQVAGLIDPASVALPETPVALTRIANAAERVTEAAQDSLSVALAPSQEIQRDLSVQLRQAQGHLTRFGGTSKARVEQSVRLLQDHLSRPEHLVSAAVGLELVFLLCHVVQFYDHAIFFPPPGGEKGTIASLLHSLFFWLPSLSANIRTPELHALRPSSDLWPAIAWWATTTVLPPFALSTLVSFVPQKGIQRTGHNTRYAASHPPTPTADPLTFALIRLAILLYPLTDAAPSSFVDSLSLSGNLQVRALGGGLLAALLLVSRITSS